MNKSAKIILIVLAIVLAVGGAFSISFLMLRDEQPVAEPAEDVWVQYGDYWYRTNGTYVEKRTPATLTCTVHYKDHDMNTIATATYEVTYYIASITIEGEQITGEKAVNREYDLEGYFLNNGKLYDEATGAAVDNVRLPMEAYTKLKTDVEKNHTLCVLSGIDKTELLTIE